MAAVLRSTLLDVANCRRDLRDSRIVCLRTAAPTHHLQMLHSYPPGGCSRCKPLHAVAIPANQQASLTDFIPGGISAKAVAAADRLSFLPFVYPGVAAAQVAALLGALPSISAPGALLGLLAAPWVLFHVATPVLDMLLDAVTAITSPAAQDQMQTIKTTSTGASSSSSSSSSSFWPRALPALYVVVNTAVVTLVASAAGTLAAPAAGLPAPALPLAATLAAALGAHLPAAAAVPLPAVLGLLVATVGVCSTIGMGAAHELIHSRHPMHQALGQLHLALSGIWCYARAHHHHHLTVGTVEDHSTGFAGETVYAFAVRYISGMWNMAWGEAVTEAHKKRRAVWSMHNRVLQGIALQLGLMAGMYTVGGVVGLGVAIGGAFMSAFYLAAFDYLLHYGLLRGEGAGGEAQPVTALQSYNSSYVIENAMLFKVLMHSEHHAVASRPYGELGSWQPKFSTASASSSSDHGQAVVLIPRLPPRLPMLSFSLLTLVPPAWSHFVDPVSQAVQQCANTMRPVK